MVGLSAGAGLGAAGRLVDPGGEGAELNLDFLSVSSFSFLRPNQTVWVLACRSSHLHLGLAEDEIRRVRGPSQQMRSTITTNLHVTS